MTCWLIIPVKPAGQAKSRLSEVLGESERAALAEAMLRHVLGAACSADQVDHVALLGPSRLGMSDAVPLLADPGGGLNPAIEYAFAQACGARADRLIILFADLPQVTSAEVNRLAAVPAGAIAMAPDRHGSGTNALSLPIPAAKGFTFAFGPDSFAKHRAEAGRLGLRIVELRSPGLARDIDVPEDLADARRLLGEQGEWTPAQST